MLGNYILAADGRTPILEPDILAWAEWFGKANRAVAQDHLGPYFVSTVFLGLDHNFGFGGLPILWETMIFVGNEAISQGRYSSYDDAARGHRDVLERVKMAVTQ